MLYYINLPVSAAIFYFLLILQQMWGERLDNYSVLMSVYFGEKPEYLRQSVESILAQTVQTDDFVLMCDGPLTEELDAVINEYCQSHGDILRVIHLEENRGLAHALNCGLKICKNDLVARMDSDDVALPRRCELQLKKFEEDPQLAIVGGAIDEFEGSPENVISHKHMPESYEDLLRYARMRNPFNHPTVMYRRSVIIAVGSYPSNILHEDYALWGNLLMSGAKACNLPDTLCNMRVDNGLYDRRGGYSYLKQAIKLRWQLYRSGLYTLTSFIVVSSGLTIVCLLSNSIRKVFYHFFLRDV